MKTLWEIMKEKAPESKLQQFIKYDSAITNLIFAAEEILRVAEEIKRPEEEITSLHEIVRHIIHIK